MSKQNTCPHCGAEKKIQTENMTLFECGTFYLAGHIYERDDACYERQLEQQAAEIERLKQALNSLLEVEELVCRFDHNGNCQSHYLDPAINGCRVAKARKLL